MVDATKVSSIKIDTGYDGVKEYPFFTRVNKQDTILDKDAQFAIVFGRNGSGKSTVAHTLSIGTGKVEFFDNGSNSLGEDCSNVHVFNESYVIENFRKYPKEKIKPVILLGNFEQRRERISELKDKISSAEEKIENVLEECINRALGENSLIAGLSFAEITVREYVDAYVRYNASQADDLEKIDVALWKRGEYFEQMEVKSIISPRITCNRDRYMWLTSLCFDFARDSVLKDLDENGAILNYSVDEIMDKMNGNYYQIYKMIESDIWDDADIIYNIGDLWCRAAYWLMLLIYKEDESLFKKINANIITQKDRRILGICEQNLERFREDLQKEQDELAKEQREYSSKQVTEYINTLLSMVFGGREIWLESDMDFGYIANNKYGVILPSRLSIGEQNILSLCYFFAEMSKGKELESSIQDNKIIVLDDPISSLDFYNKAGINWMIDYIIKIMCSVGSLSKMIIMTHSLSVAKELEKTIKGRINGIDVKSGDKLKCCDIEDLERGVLKGRDFSGDDNYRDILLKMYEVAADEGGSKGVDLPHFNDVRRVWEAFLKFELGEDKISNRNAMDRVSYFHDKKSAEGKFLESFAIYNYINQGSHSFDNMVEYDFDLAPPLSEDESRGYIQKIILFMHMVSPHHIPCRLSRKMDDISEYRDTLYNMYKKEVLKQS